MLRLMNSNQQEPHGHQSRQDGHPEDGPEIIGPEQRQPDREQGAEERHDRIERLPQAEGGASELRWGDVRDQGIPWCATHTVPDSVQQASGHVEANARSDGKERLRKGPRGVAEHGQPFPHAPIVARRP